MTDDNTAAYPRALNFADDDDSGGMAGIASVGQAFIRAISDGLATANMYGADAQTDGLMDLWFNDGTHASVLGSYLSALTLFGTLTGLDPASFGPGEVAARDLGISAREARLLQRVGSDQPGFAPAAVPEPGGLLPLAMGLGLAVTAASRRPR